ncbi:hypothetical protein [Limibacterium fermenti]|jgi:hypothetical protein|uniref:hypothetical protein n=1 Tax=Limibacterium fermenti TaxID=3229863 RepID=UPI003A6673EC
MMKKIAIVLSVFFILFASCISTENHRDYSKLRKNNLLNIKGTYASPPRLENGRVDVRKLVYELKDLNANTYNWLIWSGDKDWDDLQLFLPLAKKNKIDVWVTVVPFSEAKPRTKWSSEPFGTDYVKWAQEIATLSLQYSNIKALSIDDFVAWNLQFYTPEYTAEFVNAMRKINPHLAFVPCIYYNSTKITDYSKDYLPYFDGVLFPYKAESSGKETLNRYDLLVNEIDSLRRMFKDLPLIIDIYSSAHSKAGSSTPSYVSEMIKLSRQYGNGVCIYTHPDPVKGKEKYDVVKEEFSK